MNQKQLEKAREVEERSRITVGDLRRMLSGYPDDKEIIFGSTLAGDTLIFYRVKDRDPMVQIELNEVNESYLEGID